MANKQRDSGKEALWRRLLARHGKGGLSVREFCEREGLTEASFYFWRRTIGERDRDQPQPAFVPLVVNDRVPAPEPALAGITVELRGGRVLRLPVSIAADRLVMILRAVEGVA